MDDGSGVSYLSSLYEVDRTEVFSVDEDYDRRFISNHLYYDIFNISFELFVYGMDNQFWVQKK